MLDLQTILCTGIHTTKLITCYVLLVPPNNIIPVISFKKWFLDNSCILYTLIFAGILFSEIVKSWICEKFVLIFTTTLHALFSDHAVTKL